MGKWRNKSTNSYPQHQKGESNLTRQLYYSWIEKKTNTQWMEAWVGPRGRLDIVAKNKISAPCGTIGANGCGGSKSALRNIKF